MVFMWLMIKVISEKTPGHGGKCGSHTIEIIVVDQSNESLVHGIHGLVDRPITGTWSVIRTHGSVHESNFTSILVSDST